MANNSASDKLEAAINEALTSSPDHREGDILVEWAVITFVTNPDSEDGDAYPCFVSNGLIPTHHLRGLLHTQLHFLDNHCHE